MTASPNPATVGGTVTWTFSITNKLSSNRLVAPTTSINTTGLPSGCTLTRGTGWSSEGGVYYIPAGTTATYTCTTSAPTTTTTYSVSTVANGTSNGMRAATYDCGWFSCSWNYNSTALGSVTATETLLLGPDLTVTKTVSASTVTVGQAVTYTITVTNSGSATTNTFTLTDKVPSNFTNLQVPTGCTVAADNTVTCPNQTIGSTPKAYTITGTATIKGDTSNTASVSGLTGETNTGNNTSPAANVTIQQADLTVTKTATPNPVVAGQPVTFTITVKNTGNAASSTYTLTDVVPAQFTNVQFNGTPPSGCSITGNAVTCANQGSLAASTGSRTYTLTATASTAGDYSNTATISATSHEPTGNNAATFSGSIQAAEADLTITKSASPSTGVLKGQTVTYTVAVKNSGNTASSSYTLTDPVPAAFTNVTFTAPTGACSADGNTVNWLFTEQGG